MQFQGLTPFTEPGQGALAGGGRKEDVEGIGRVGEAQQRGVKRVRRAGHRAAVDAEAQLDAGIRSDDLAVSGGERGFHPFPLVTEGSARDRHRSGDSLLARGRAVGGDWCDRQRHHGGAAIHHPSRDHRADATEGKALAVGEADLDRRIEISHHLGGKPIGLVAIYTLHGRGEDLQGIVRP